MLLSLYQTGSPAHYAGAGPVQINAATKESVAAPGVAATLLYVTTTSPGARAGDAVAALRNLEEVISKQKGEVLAKKPGEMVALFLDNGRANSAYLATSAALQLLEQFTTLNKRWTAVAEPAMRLGIGLHTGQISRQSQAHALQPEDAPSIQILALARQLSQLNQQAPFPTAFVSQATFSALPPEPQWHVEYLGTMQLGEAEQTEPIHAVMPAAQLQQIC